MQTSSCEQPSPPLAGGYPDRFLDLLERRGEPTALLNGAIYMAYSKMVVPFGPADADYTLSRSDAARTLKQLGGVLVRTTDGFEPSGGAHEWYALICREFTGVAEIQSSNMRSKLRRGLRNCEVRRLSPEELADSGYAVGMRALERYRGAAPPLSPADFASRTLAAADFEDIVHYWGVFCDGELAGWTINYIFGETEAVYSAITLDPAFLRRYSSYALFHRMNEHYLAEQRFSYVNNGFRSILHDSQVQEFLEHNFGFERGYTRLATHYRPPYGALIRGSFPLRGLIGRVDHRLRALYEVERVARASRQ